MDRRPPAHQGRRPEKEVARRRRPSRDKLEGPVRQQLLFLCLATPNPMSQVVAWSIFDGTGRTSPMAGDADQPPYESMLAAMKDGWRVIQVPTLQSAAPG